MKPCRRLNLFIFNVFFLMLFAFSQLVSGSNINVTLNGSGNGSDGGSQIRGNNRSFVRPEKRHVGSFNKNRTIAKIVPATTTISPLTTITTVDPLIDMVHEAKHAFQPITGNNNAHTRYQLKLQQNGRFNMGPQTTVMPHHLRHQNSPANYKRKSINPNTSPSLRFMSHRQMTTPRILMTTTTATTTKVPKSTTQHPHSKIIDNNTEDIDDVLDDDEDDYFEDSVEIDDLDVSGSSQRDQKRRFDWMQAIMNNAIAASITKGGRQRIPNYKDYHRLGWDFKEYPDDEPIEKINIKKISDYDTKEALEEAIRKEKARLHFISVSAAAECRLPQPRVIHVEGNPLNTYVPPCTILYRCGTDTGCCESPLQICAPKTTEIVQLMFYVLKLGKESQAVAPLSFINHTECHCVTQTRQLYQNNRNENVPLEFQTNKMKITSGNIEPVLTTSSPLVTIDRCKCPDSFTEMIEINNDWENTAGELYDYDSLQPYRRCFCDCMPGSAKCRRLKNGLSLFSRKDRGCLMEGRCTLPTCEYGQYKLKNGHCPLKTEKNRNVQRLSFD